MNGKIRIAIVACCFLLCAGAVIVTHRWTAPIPNSAALDSDIFMDGYEQVAGASHQELAFSEYESIIRRDKKVQSHQGRIEFGSAKVKGATAIIEVFFFEADGEMTPFFYKLNGGNKSWKIESVQRIWFVPRSHLLRGLRI